MLQVDSEIFVQRPEESERRVLHAAKLVDASEHLTARLQEPGFELTADQVIFVYYELNREFVKQLAQVTAVLIEEDDLLVGFRTSGEPVSAESRQFYRVVTVMANLIVGIGPEKSCPLTDVSAMGFSAIAGRTYVIGEQVAVTLHFEGDSFSGNGVVQSIKDLGDQTSRYGFLASTDSESGKQLQKGLQRISMAIQRQQLKRRARA